MNRSAGDKNDISYLSNMAETNACDGWSYVVVKSSYERNVVL